MWRWPNVELSKDKVPHYYDSKAIMREVVIREAVIGEREVLCEKDSYKRRRAIIKEGDLSWGGGGGDRGSTSLIPNFFKTSHLPDEINAFLKLPSFAWNGRRSHSLTAGGLGHCKCPSGSRANPWSGFSEQNPWKLIDICNFFTLDIDFFGVFSYGTRTFLIFFRKIATYPKTF